MSEFSLRKLAREVWEDLGSADYHVVAKELARRVPPNRREAALDEALLEYARHFVVGLRPTARKTKPGAGQRNSGRSAKVAGIRRMWPQLRATYLTRDGQKALAECSRVDVVFIAEHLDKKARECTRKGAWMRGLAGEMATHEVERVRDLPDEVLAQYLDGTAAA